MNLENLAQKIFGSKEKPRQETSPREKYKSSPQEMVLSSRGFERTGKFLGGAIGNARFVKIVDDGGGVFKPHTDYEDFPNRKRYFLARERAAYLISRFLGFDFVPPTIIKLVDGKEGSLQEFVEDAQVGYEAQNIPKEERIKLRIFDNLVCNTDRHGGNYLVKEDKVFAIDHGYILPSVSHLEYGDMDIDNVPTDLSNRLKSFMSSKDQQEVLRDLLGELLEGDIVDAFMKRVLIFIGSIGPNNAFDQEKFYNLLGN